MNVTAIAPFVLGTCLLVTASAALGATTATVKGVDFLRVRAAPSFDAPETTILKAGATVEIVEELGFWASIVLPNGTRGYASRKYLAATTAEQPHAGSGGAAGAASVETPPAVGAGGAAVIERGEGAAASSSGTGGGPPAVDAGTHPDAPVAPTPPAAAADTAATPAPAPPPVERGDAAAVIQHGDEAAAHESAAAAPAAEAGARTHPQVAPDPPADTPAAQVPPTPSPVEETAARPTPPPVPANGASPGPACTRADVDALRADVRALAGMMTVKTSVAAARAPGSQAVVLARFPPDRPQLIWFGIGGLIGWLLGRISGVRDRWRRNRIRI